MWTTHWRYEPAVLYSGGWLWIEPKALIFFSMSLKPYYLRHISGSYALPVSSFFTFGTLLCFFMLYHVLKTWKKTYSLQHFYGLGSGTGVSHCGGHCDRWPRNSFPEGFVDPAASSSVFRWPSALSLFRDCLSCTEPLAQGHGLFPGQPTFCDWLMWEYKGWAILAQLWTFLKSYSSSKVFSQGSYKMITVCLFPLLALASFLSFHSCRLQNTPDKHLVF